MTQLTRKVAIATILLCASASAQVDVSRTKLWAKFVADSIGGNDGDAVALWDNLQGTADRDLLQSVAIDKPTLKTNIINGHAVVRFDGVTEYMDGTNDNTGMGEADLYVIVRVVTDPPLLIGQSGWMYMLASSTITESAHFPYISGSIYESFRRFHTRVNFNPTPALTTFRLYSVHAATNKYTIRIDTTTVYNDASAFTPDASNGGYQVGRSSQAYFLDGDIAELRIYVPKLSDAQRDTVYYNFDIKYNLGYDPPIGIGELSVGRNRRCSCITLSGGR